MNDTNLNKNSENPNNNTYHATTNLNTAIENPEINMGSVTGINIADNNNINNNNNSKIQNNNSLDNLNVNPKAPNQNYQINNNQLQTPNFSDYSSEYETNFYNTNDDNQHYSYEPIIQEKKNNASSNSNIIHSKEAKLMVFILLILIIFLLIIPYIYDFLVKS